MSSRPFLLLQKQHHRISTAHNYSWGLTAKPVEHNIFLWKCSIRGFSNTCWEGGIFLLDLQFSLEYDECPPKVTFTTVPFHPNIHFTTGKPCTAILETGPNGDWVNGMGVIQILLHMQLLLHSPVLEGAINPDAAEMYTVSPRLYEQFARDAVLASIQWNNHMSKPNADLDAGDEKLPFQMTVSALDLMALQREEAASAPAAIEDEATQLDGNKRVEAKADQRVSLSFESYYDSWKDLATSYVHPASTTNASRLVSGGNASVIMDTYKKLLEDIVFSTDKNGRYGLGFPNSGKVEERDDHYFKQLLIQQHALMYGLIKPSKPIPDHHKRKEERINALQRLYRVKFSIPDEAVRKLKYTPKPPAGKKSPLHISVRVHSSEGDGQPLPLLPKKKAITQSMPLPPPTPESLETPMGFVKYSDSRPRSAPASPRGSRSHKNTLDRHLNHFRVPHTPKEKEPVKQRDEEWEVEAEDLVEWSQNLSADSVESIALPEVLHADVNFKDSYSSDILRH